MIHGKIASYPKRSSLTAPFNKELLEEVVVYIPKAFQVQLTYENVIVKIIRNQRGDMETFEQITGNRTSYETENSIQLTIMELILKLYQILNPIIMGSAILCYVVIMIRFFSKKYRLENDKEIIVMNGLLYLYIARITVVGFVAATEYQSAIAKCQYLASAYPIQSIFSIVCIVFVIQEMLQYRKKKVESKEETI